MICGESEDSAYYDQLRNDIATLGLRNRVTLLGRVGEKEKLRLYADCLAVLYPPSDEDYGYITLEAMLSSKAVVTCTDSGGPLEFVVDGVTGSVAAPEPEPLGRAMARMWENRAVAATMGKAGREYYLARNITWEVVVAALVS